MTLQSTPGMPDAPLEHRSQGRSEKDRFERLETAISHCQQDIEELSGSLNSTLSRLRDLETRMTQLEQHLVAPREEQELPDPLDERPPHY